jgi:hypothetical protein
MYISLFLLALTSMALGAAIGDHSGPIKQPTGSTHLEKMMRVQIFSGYKYKGKLQVLDVQYDKCTPVDG